ncbi:MAG TPA: hypothetical protein VGB24_16035 [Longimicrobium sp.]|uniref:hypothetical protein n=1 Tax=Longimicrobium sp. TaxID=2029185 RepID=UPI002EDA9611
MFHYRVNALTLEPDTARHYRLDSDVRIVVMETNPFVYDYEISVKNQPVAEASIGDFFSGVLKITLPSVTAPEVTSDVLTYAVTGGKAGNADDAADDSDACSAGARVAGQNIAAMLIVLSQHHRDIQNRFQDLDAMSSAADRAWAAEKGIYLDPRTRASDVMSSAARAADTLKNFRSALNARRDQLRPLVPAYAKNVANVNRVALAAATQDPSCEILEEISIVAARFVPDTTVFNSSFATVSERAASLARTPEALAAIANDSSRFYVTGLLRRYHRPTDVTVQIARRNANTTEPYRGFTSQRLNFGGRARWSFSAGLGASTLGNNDFGTRTTRIAPPAGSPGDTTALVVVATKSSQANVFPMITFNTRLMGATHAINPHLVFGVGTNDLTKPRVGFLLGGGVDAFGERAIFTVGGLIGEETRLASGLELGDRVSSTQAVAKETRVMVRPAVAVTYRLF